MAQHRVDTKASSFIHLHYDIPNPQLFGMYKTVPKKAPEPGVRRLKKYPNGRFDREMFELLKDNDHGLGNIRDCMVMNAGIVSNMATLKTIASLPYSKFSVNFTVTLYQGVIYLERWYKDPPVRVNSPPMPATQSTVASIPTPKPIPNYVDNSVKAGAAKSKPKKGKKGANKENQPKPSTTRPKQPKEPVKQPVNLLQSSIYAAQLFSDSDVNYIGLYYMRINEHKIIMTSPIDAVVDDLENLIKPADYLMAYLYNPKVDVTKLKAVTCETTYINEWENIFTFTTMRSAWTQMVLTGSENIYLGFINDEHELANIKSFDLKTVHDIRSCWAPSVLMNFLDYFFIQVKIFLRRIMLDSDMNNFGEITLDVQKEYGVTDHLTLVHMPNRRGLPLQYTR